MPDEEKALHRLGIDGFSLVRAGTETMGSSKYSRKHSIPLVNAYSEIALSLITYHLLSKPHLLEKLRKELETVFPDPTVMPPCGMISLP